MSEGHQEMKDRAVVLTVGVSDTMAARLRHAACSQGDFKLVEADGTAEAQSILRDAAPDVVIVNLALEDQGPVAFADYVAFRRPQARVIFEMGPGGAFSDGSIFAHAPTARGVVTPGMPTGDVAAVVAHHAMAAAG